jgi:hypothetical protein
MCGTITSARRTVDPEVSPSDHLALTLHSYPGSHESFQRVAVTSQAYAQHPARHHRERILVSRPPGRREHRSRARASSLA